MYILAFKGVNCECNLHVMRSERTSTFNAQYQDKFIKFIICIKLHINSMLQVLNLREQFHFQVTKD